MARDDLPLEFLTSQFSDLGTALANEDGSGISPDRVVAFAADAIPGTNHCGLTLIRPGQRPRTLAATDDLPRAVDAIQYSVGEGPCLDAATRETFELTGDLGTDERWPVFGPRCRQSTGVVSMLTIRLSLAGGDQAAINFYSRQAEAFVDFDIGVASILAPLAALSVEHTLRTRDTQHLKEALTSSRQIGTAIGIIMARELVSSDEAFELLRSASQHLNRKLRDVAAEIAATGELPRPDDR